MKKLFFSLLMIGMTSPAFAQTETLDVVCGDTASSYVQSDLSREFQANFLSPENTAKLKAEGLTHAFAGRNCGLGGFDSPVEYDVLVLTKSEKFLLRDQFGPFGIVGAEIRISGDLNAVKSGVILTGVRGNLTNKEGTVKAKISAARVSSAPIMVIVQLIKKD